MKPTLILLGKEATLFLKDKVAISLTFIVPIALIYILGNVFGNLGNGGPDSGISLAILDQIDSEATRRLVAAFQEDEGLKIIIDAEGPTNARLPLTEERIRQDIENNKYRFALIIPPDALKRDALGIKLRFLDNPVNQIESQIVQGLLQKNLFTGLPLVLVDQLAAQFEALGGEFS